MTLPQELLATKLHALESLMGIFEWKVQATSSLTRSRHDALYPLRAVRRRLVARDLRLKRIRPLCLSELHGYKQHALRAHRQHFTHTPR